MYHKSQMSIVTTEEVHFSLVLVFTSGGFIRGHLGI